ncbi:MAG: SGNH/GDSL hydrolase family protein, partial [Actinomycetota bacterium]|nr:SGNH/GDSL hydrolase family protein [Actinomycetota bacterium]
HQLVGLGDSVPAASACECTGFVAGVAQRLSLPGHQVASVNLATPGSTSSDLKDDLTAADERSTIAASDVVLVEVGANDMTLDPLTDPACLGSDKCWKSDLNGLDGNIRQILSTLRSLRPADPAVIAVVGYWNVGESGDMGAAKGPTYVRNARLLTNSVNRLLEKDCASADAIYVDADAAFGSDDRAMTSLLAPDGDHPNAEGHDVLAAAVVTAIRGAGD